MERSSLLDGSLATVSLDRLAALVAQISASSRIRVEKPPATALVMMGTREAVQWTPFYLGEVLVSHCAVTVDGAMGFGCVLGGDLERAYCLAVIDAAVAGSHPLCPSVEALRREAAQERRRQELLEHATVAKTRVRFETMEERSDDEA